MPCVPAPQQVVTQLYNITVLETAAANALHFTPFFNRICFRQLSREEKQKSRIV
jgi:hypothetical protein